jgi:hypothetical protein
MSMFTTGMLTIEDLTGSNPTFCCQLNPTSYKRNWGGSGTAKETTTKDDNGNLLANGIVIPDVTPPAHEKFDLSFTLDGTGVVPSLGWPIDIISTIDDLKVMGIDINPDLHENNKLNVSWGDWNIDCRMKSMSVDYTLFNALGNPVRAVVNLSFEEYFELDEILEDYASPDMSHMIEVKQGDNLPLMCQKIYGDAGYYLQVAEANDIVDFRNLIPGQMLLFPRLDK